jgi:hypothetical protein
MLGASLFSVTSWLVVNGPVADKSEVYRRNGCLAGLGFPIGFERLVTGSCVNHIKGQILVGGSRGKFRRDCACILHQFD